MSERENDRASVSRCRCSRGDVAWRGSCDVRVDGIFESEKLFLASSSAAVHHRHEESRERI